MKYQPKTLLYDARLNLGSLALLHTWLAGKPQFTDAVPINTSMHMYIYMCMHIYI